MNEPKPRPNFDERVDQWQRALGNADHVWLVPLADNPVFRHLLRRWDVDAPPRRKVDDLPALCAEARVRPNEALEGATAYYLGRNYPVGGPKGELLTLWRTRLRPHIVLFIALGWLAPLVAAVIANRSLPRTGSILGAFLLLCVGDLLLWSRERARLRSTAERLERESAAKALRLFQSFEQSVAKKSAILALRVALVFVFLRPAFLLFILAGLAGFIPVSLARNDEGSAEFFSAYNGDFWNPYVAVWSVMLGGYIFCVVIRAIQWVVSPSWSRIEGRFAESYRRLMERETR